MLLLVLLACSDPGPEGDAEPVADETGGHDTAGCVPGTEVCNGADDDCDGAIDEAASDAVTVYTDADGDGFGDPATASPACGGLTDGTDCDDADATVFPGAEDVRWDGIDQDCDGADHDCADAGAIYAGDLRLEEVGDFCDHYAAVDGDLSVYADDLTGLGCLCEVTGRLLVTSDTAGTLAGLDGLARVGALSLYGTTALESLDGLEQLRSAEAIAVYEAPALVDLTALAGLRALESLDIWHAAALPDLRGLEGVAAVVGDHGGIELLDLPALTSLDGLDGLRAVTTLGLYQLPALTDLDALAGLETAGSVRLDTVAAPDLPLRSLQGVDTFVLRGTALVSLAGLERLTELREELTLSDNPVLTDVDALACAGPELSVLEVVDNPALADLPLAGLEEVDGIHLGGNGLTSLDGLGGLGEAGTFTIAETRLADLGGLSSLGNVGALSITGTAVVSLGGLENVRTVESLEITDNPALVDLSALDGAELTGVFVARNDALPDLAGLSTFADDGYLWVYENPALETLDGFVPPHRLGSLGVSGNAVLTDISAAAGMRDLDALRVTDNPRLPTADAEALCVSYGLTGGGLRSVGQRALTAPVKPW